MMNSENHDRGISEQPESNESEPGSIEAMMGMLQNPDLLPTHEEVRAHTNLLLVFSLDELNKFTPVSPELDGTTITERLAQIAQDMTSDPLVFRRRWLEAYQDNMDEHPEYQEGTLSMFKTIEEADDKKRREIFNKLDGMLVAEIEKVRAYKERRAEILRPHVLAMLKDLK